MSNLYIKKNLDHFLTSKITRIINKEKCKFEVDETSFSFFRGISLKEFKLIDKEDENVILSLNSLKLQGDIFKLFFESSFSEISVGELVFVIETKENPYEKFKGCFLLKEKKAEGEKRKKIKIKRIIFDNITIVSKKGQIYISSKGSLKKEKYLWAGNFSGNFLGKEFHSKISINLEKMDFKVHTLFTKSISMPLNNGVLSFRKINLEIYNREKIFGKISDISGQINEVKFDYLKKLLKKEIAFNIELQGEEVFFYGSLNNLLKFIANRDLNSILEEFSITIKNGDLKIITNRDQKNYWNLKNSELSIRKTENGDFYCEFYGTMKFNKKKRGSISLKGNILKDGGVQNIQLSMDGLILPLFFKQFIKRVLIWDDTELILTSNVERKTNRLIFNGVIEGKNLGFFSTKICLIPLEDISFRAEYFAELDIENKVLTLEFNPIIVKDGRYSMKMELQRVGKTPKINLKFIAPEQPCKNLISSIPPQMIPRLQGIDLEGWINLQVQAVIDFKDLREVDIKVDGNDENCNVLTLGGKINVEDLNRNFIHRIELEGREEIEVGPGKKDNYVPLSQIPFYVQQEALATEDMGFFYHKGFKLGLIRRALKLDLDRGRYVYGGSTISQQLVKNLFLSTEKTLARKIEEAIITWHMERVIPKNRILELYLNCIQFGPKIYGIKSASKIYFGKEPSDLTPLEGAFIMATKPDPKYAYNIYKLKIFNEWWQERMKNILKRLYEEMGVIDELTFKAAEPYIPEFYYPVENQKE